MDLEENRRFPRLMQDANAAMMVSIPSEKESRFCRLPFYFPKSV